MDRVSEQVCDHLRDSLLVTLAEYTGKVGVDLNSAFCGQWADQVEAFARGACKVELRSMHGFLTGVQAGQFEQRLDQLAHALRGALAGLQRLAVFSGRTLPCQCALRLGKNN